MNTYKILVTILPVIFATWETKQIVGIARELATQRFITCVGIVHPIQPHQSQPEAVSIVKQLKNDLYTRVLSLNVSNDTRNWIGCSQVLYLILSYLPHAQHQIAQFIANARGPIPVWLNFLPQNSTAEEFIGVQTFPLASQFICAASTKTGITLTAAFRIAAGHDLHLVPYAHYSETHGLDCAETNCEFYVISNLEGIPFRATTKTDPPICDLAVTNNTLRITGYFGAVLDDLAQQLNFRVEIIPATENRTGSFENGAWNGLIGMLQRNETDLAVGPMSLYQPAMDVTNNLRPLLRTSFQIFFRQHGTIVQWDAFLKPFHKLVWYSIAFWLLVNAIILHLFYRLGTRFGYEPRIYTGEYNKINSFFSTLTAFCQQGSNRLPKSLSIRSLVLTGYLTSSVLFTAYSASLISKIALQEPSRPFDSLETFLKDGTYSLITIARSSEYNYFSEANNILLKSIYEKSMKRFDVNQLPGTKEDALIEICVKDKTALFITFAATHVAAEKVEKTYFCKLLTLSEPITNAFLTILTQKQNPITGILNRQLQIMMERGSLKRLQNKEWPLKQHITSPSFQPVELKQIIQITAILAFGMFVSLLILILEIITSKLTTS